MAYIDPRIRTLLTQANRNAENGKNAAAESIYRQILAEAPDTADAWLGLAGVVADPTEKHTAYERSLELAPDSLMAIAGLAILDGRPVPPEVEAALAAAELEKQPPQPEPPTFVEAVEESANPHEDEAAYQLTCYRHPDRATSLRCYNCERPICISCANKTPVGYICPECRREAEDAFFNSRPLDYLIAVMVSLPISLLAGYLLVNFFRGGFLFFILIFFFGGAIGSFIGRITKRAIGGRRGRYLPGLVVAMMILGVAIPALPLILAVLTGNIGGLLSLLGPGIYLFIAGGAAYWQMR
ncbi:MAG: hypothetical protein KBF17_09265 [Candidatus Promineofilum sp.]|nr:hypothetical protein [Promineifilum sp.]MBP9657563.1 hypothetical protein [Promineifilum sp.]